MILWYTNTVSLEVQQYNGKIGSLFIPSLLFEEYYLTKMLAIICISLLLSVQESDNSYRINEGGFSTD